MRHQTHYQQSTQRHPTNTQHQHNPLYPHNQFQHNQPVSTHSSIQPIVSRHTPISYSKQSSGDNHGAKHTPNSYSKMSSGDNHGVVPTKKTSSFTQSKPSDQSHSIVIIKTTSEYVHHINTTHHVSNQLINNLKLVMQQSQNKDHIKQYIKHISTMIEHKRDIRARILSNFLSDYGHTQHKIIKDIDELARGFDIIRTKDLSDLQDQLVRDLQKKIEEIKKIQKDVSQSKEHCQKELLGIETKMSSLVKEYDSQLNKSTPIGHNKHKTISIDYTSKMGEHEQKKKQYIQKKEKLIKEKARSNYDGIKKDRLYKNYKLYDYQPFHVVLVVESTQENTKQFYSQMVKCLKTNHSSSKLSLIEFNQCFAVLQKDNKSIHDLDDQLVFHESTCVGTGHGLELAFNFLRGLLKIQTTTLVFFSGQFRFIDKNKFMGMYKQIVDNSSNFYMINLVDDPAQDQKYFDEILKIQDLDRECRHDYQMVKQKIDFSFTHHLRKDTNDIYQDIKTLLHTLKYLRTHLNEVANQLETISIHGIPSESRTQFEQDLQINDKDYQQIINEISHLQQEKERKNKDQEQQNKQQTNRDDIITKKNTCESLRLKANETLSIMVGLSDHQEDICQMLGLLVNKATILSQSTQDTHQLSEDAILDYFSDFYNKCLRGLSQPSLGFIIQHGPQWWQNNDNLLMFLIAKQQITDQHKTILEHACKIVTTHQIIQQKISIEDIVHTVYHKTIHQYQQDVNQYLPIVLTNIRNNIKEDLKPFVRKRLKKKLEEIMKEQEEWFRPVQEIEYMV